MCGMDVVDGVLELLIVWLGGGREGLDMCVEWCRKVVMKENMFVKYGVFVVVKVVGGWSV